ncbi:hypothetical protein G5I_03552 [Acromyrmex echinatior]|uniref:Uncharacterized protein n=1 Tax=Acromyrmex echinatior TaxID=103372 RepID=F4WD99_ACREC|nr:hypothetical protein G5I_03552 [Acromyrmex echinatior]
MSPQPHHAADNNNDAKKICPPLQQISAERLFPSGWDIVSIEDESSPGTGFSIVAGHLGFFTQSSNCRISVSGSLLYAFLYCEGSRSRFHGTCFAIFRHDPCYQYGSAVLDVDVYNRPEGNKSSVDRLVASARKVQKNQNPGDVMAVCPASNITNGLCFRSK